MAINFSQNIYLPAYNIFARPVTVTPKASQPNVPAYSARGIFDTVPYDIPTEDGSIFSDQRTILDVLDAEFTVVPIQGDIIDIPTTAGVIAGTFEVIDADINGGGETTLTLRRIMDAKP